MFTKNLHLCFSKIKCLPISFSTLDEEHQQCHHQDHHHHHHHQHHDHHHDHHQDDLFLNNFNTIYDASLSAATTTTTTAATDDLDSTSTTTTSSSSPPPDFSTAFASRRFFVSSPGQSNSILDSSTWAPQPDPDHLVGGGVPVRKYSPDPFSDFRKSMQEMIEAKEKEEENLQKNSSNIINDWEYLHQLLLSYLSLNPTHTHKFIIGAFADLLVSLMDSSSSSPND